MYRVGVDLGGTNIAVGVVDDNFNIIGRGKMKTNAPRDAKAIFDDIATAVKMAVADANLRLYDIASIGIGTPGSVNKEIGMIEKLSLLKPDQQEMIREQIKLRYLIPVITKVLDVKDEYGYAYWHAQTNFGVCRFTTRMSGNAVVSLSDSRLMVTDIDGNRYEIPDFYQLSVMERKKLDLFI